MTLKALLKERLSDPWQLRWFQFGPWLPTPYTHLVKPVLIVTGRQMLPCCSAEGVGAP